MVASRIVLLALTGPRRALSSRRPSSVLRSSWRSIRVAPLFPGNRLGLFLAICGVFFVAQMSAVLVLAEVGEADESARGNGAGMRRRSRRRRSPRRRSRRKPAGSDPVGKEIFLGTAAALPYARRRRRDRRHRPNLDATKPSVELAVERVTNGAGAMPSFADTLSEEQIQEVATYVSAAAGTRAVRLSPLGEVSERPKERDWKSRTC